MNKAVADDYEGIVDLNNNSDGLGKVESISNIDLEEEEEFFDAMEDVSNVEEESDLDLATSEEEESISDLEEVEEFFDSNAAAFSVPLSIFHYKDYNSDFFTSWYNMSSGILKKINRTCPEKKVLNLALSVLMLPYIAFTALGLVVYSRLNSKKQEGVGEDKTKKSETGVPKRLAYGVLAAIAIFVNVTVLVALIVPATVALATFYLLNRDLSHSLVAAFKISMGQYSNKHQNIEVSFRETEVSGPSIAYDMEIKFPPQFKRLLIDLCENENNQWFSVTRDSEHNIVLKLSTNINLKNGLKPLRNEINDVLTTSIKELAKAMEELMKLKKEDITYDKMKSLLNEFRLKVVDSIGSKLTTHLIENAYQVAFIQAVKFAQKRRKDFSLEDVLRDILVKQELESQGKELLTEREMIIRDLKKLKRKEALNVADEDDRLEAFAKIGDIFRDIKDDALPVFKAKWEQFIQEGKITKKAITNVYKGINPGETEEALNNAEKIIEDLKEEGRERYIRVREKLKEVYDEGKNNLINDDLKRKLEGLFKFEYDNQEVEQRLVKSVMRKAKDELSRLGRLSLIEQFVNLEKKIKDSFSKEALDEVNDFVEKVYLEITKCKMQNLFKGQAKGIENSCKLLEREALDLVEKINSHRVRIEEYLKRPEQPMLLRKIIEGSKDLNKYLEDERKRKGEKHPNTKLIQKHLENNQKILKALKQLELEKEGLLINKKTKNDYREELKSREKIKFAIIEDDLLKAFKHETFDEEEIKKLLEEAELEYYLAEKCIKTPIIKIKNNIKHFCQDLLSPLVDRLANLIINNVPKDNESGLWRIWNSLKVGFNYNVIGWSATVNKDNSTEGKALSVAHDTHKEVETFLQHFQSSYEEVGVFFGNLFSDDGTTFKNDVWPKVEEHLHGMWDRFFKDIEFKIGNKLDEVNVTQQNQETSITA